MTGGDDISRKENKTELEIREIIGIQRDIIDTIESKNLVGMDTSEG